MFDGSFFDVFSFFVVVVFAEWQGEEAVFFCWVVEWSFGLLVVWLVSCLVNVWLVSV